MKVYRIVCSIAVALAAAAAAAGEAAPQSRLNMTQAALDTNSLQGGFNSSSPDLAPSAAAPITIEPAPDVARPQNPARSGGREPRGNPLWAVPLKSLTATRERPIFLPSRRAFAPAIAGPPPPPPPAPPAGPKEPDRPRLALVGAVVGEAEGIAVFLDQTNQAIIRLRTGENHSGWILRSVKGREATLQKDRETVLLALPAPTDPVAFPGIPGLPGLPPLPPNPGLVGVPTAPPTPPLGPRLIPGTNQPEL
jgi:general secretion pathway protein N